MAVETEEKEPTTAEKLAKSSGDDTDKYSEQLEAEADAMLDKVYRPEKFQEDQKANKEEEEADAAKQEEEEKKEEESEKEETKEEEKEEKPAEEKKADEVVDDEIKADDADTVAELKEKLVKSEQRVKETRTVYSKSQKELKDEKVASNAITERFTETLKNLENLSQKAEAGTKQEEKIADAEIKETVVDLKEQFEKLNNIDPEIAAPMKEIMEALTGNITDLKGQLSNLKTEIQTKEETASKTAQQTADETHYAKIDKAHPDNEETTGSDEFNEYVEGLSPRNKRLAQQDLKGGSAENIIELIDDYKVATGTTTEETKEPDTTKTDTTKSTKLEKVKKMVGPELNKSKEVKTSKKVIYTRAMLKEHHGDTVWFAKHEAAIDKEMAAGNIPDN